MKMVIFVAAAALAAASPAYAQPATHAGHDMPQAPATQGQQTGDDTKAQEHAAHEGHDCAACCAKMKADGKAAESAHQGRGMSQ
jgi:hypothetical protein